MWATEEIPATDPVALSRKLLEGSGEATSLAIAQHIFECIAGFNTDQRLHFFLSLALDFGVDEDAIQQAIDNWEPGDSRAARRLHFVSEPASQELFRRLNRISGGTAQLVKLREHLLDAMRQDSRLSMLDDDLKHLFRSWFNRGFLQLRRIDWTTSAEELEKIISYEAVHSIDSWNDLRQRVAAPDRRLYAFFHPALPKEPLIFVEVALTRSIPNAIGPILTANRETINPETATTAAFYSISNCQRGLKGISFGNFLIKQVVALLSAELPDIKTWVTLSPVPGLRRWMDRVYTGEMQDVPDEIRQLVAAQKQRDSVQAEKIRQLAAWYLLHQPGHNRRVSDPVAGFHLGNGASLHDIHTDADSSGNGEAQSYGIMVNYLYATSSIESNHEDFINDRDIAVSDTVKKLIPEISR